MSDIHKCFEILNLPANTSYEEAKAAYRELASILHPDKHMHNERIRCRATEKFKQLQSAWNELDAYYKDSTLNEPVNCGRQQSEEPPTKTAKSEQRAEASSKNKTTSRETVSRKANSKSWRSRENLNYTQYRCPRCGQFSKIEEGKSPTLSKCNVCGEFFSRTTEAMLKRRTKYKFIRAMVFYALFYAGLFKLLGGGAILITVMTAPLLVLFTIIWHLQPDGWRTS